MTTVSESQAEKIGVPRLFNFDLPGLKKTGRVLPERNDISSVKSILDVACGDGAWAMAAAQAAPQIQILGIERDARLVEDARAQADAQKIHNVSFRVMEPFEPLDLPDDSFDLVNARFLIGMLPASNWPQVLREYMRVTRSGGYVRLTENDLPIPGCPAMGQLGGLIAQALYETKRSFSPNGRLLSITPVLQRLLQEAGCQDIRRSVYVSNFSADMETHEAVCKDLAITYQRARPFLLASGAVTEADFDRLYQEMLTEMQGERFCALAFYLTTWGSKP